VLGGPNARPTCLTFSGDGKLALVGSQDCTATLWDSATGKALRHFRGTWDNPAAGPKENLLPVGHLDSVLGVALSGDGKTAATASADLSAILWDTATGKALHRLGGHHRAVLAVAFSGDGKRVLTGSADHTAVLWDVATGKGLRLFAGHTAQVISVVLSADGKTAWTGSRDGTVRAWDTATGKELCALLVLDSGRDWLVVTPEGYHDGSEGGRRFLAFRVPGTLQVVDDDATRQRFYRPGLLARLLKGENVP
jgi:WD40 repeat protein